MTVMTVHPKARSARYWVKVLAACALVTVAMHQLVSRYGIGISDELKQSMNQSVFLIDRGDRVALRGDYVIFELVEPLRHWPRGTRFVKRVEGIAGDVVEVAADVTRVNGVAVAGELDVLGILRQPASDFERTEVVPTGYLFVVGEQAASFDSRYWGWVSTRQVIGKGYGLW